MRSFVKNKRGVSPLIATVLLIAFAVALGAVVMQFGSGLESSGCGADLQITTDKACVRGSGTGGSIILDIKNIGAVNIGKVQLWVYGDKDGIKTKVVDKTVKTSSTENFETEYDFSAYGKVKRIEATPYLEDGTECSDNKVRVSQIKNC